MSSQAGRSREEERRLSIRTLAVASVASALAAVVVSRFWTSGTPIAAAVTPVIVTIVSELLNRPAERIAERFTTQTYALPQDSAPGLRPPGKGAPQGREGPPPGSELPRPRDLGQPQSQRGAPPPVTPARAPGAPASDVRVYRSKRALPWKAIAVTAALAFAIAATVLTVSELIAGQSAGRAGRSTTLWGGASESKDEQRDRSRNRQKQAEEEEKAPPRQSDEPAPKPEPDPQPGKKKPRSEGEGAPKPAPAPKTPPTQTAPAPPPPTTPAPSPQPQPPQ